MKTLWSALRRDKKGATSIEYAVVGAFLSILIVAGATSIGTRLNGYFTKVSGNLN